MAKIIGRRFDGTLIYDTTSTQTIVETIVEETVNTAVPEVIAQTRLNDLLPPDGTVDFNEQEALLFRIKNRSADPVDPAIGQIWLRTDL